MKRELFFFRLYVNTSMHFASKKNMHQKMLDYLEGLYNEVRPELQHPLQRQPPPPPPDDDDDDERPRPRRGRQRQIEPSDRVLRSQSRRRQ